MKKVALITILLVLIVSCASKKVEIYDGDSNAIEFAGGNGSSIANAVKILHAQNSQSGIQAEYYYISMQYGAYDEGWKVLQQSLVSTQSGNKYDFIRFMNLKDRTTHEIYFDINDFYGKF